MCRITSLTKEINTKKKYKHSPESRSWSSLLYSGRPLPYPARSAQRRETHIKYTVQKVKNRDIVIKGIRDKGTQV
ncbi:hypothetical protein BJX96DRAFT_123778 [Aspergillus floccosus]